MGRYRFEIYFLKSYLNNKILSYYTKKVILINILYTYYNNSIKGYINFFYQV